MHAGVLRGGGAETHANKEVVGWEDDVDTAAVVRQIDALGCGCRCAVLGGDGTANFDVHESISGRTVVSCLSPSRLFQSREDQNLGFEMVGSNVGGFAHSDVVHGRRNGVDDYRTKSIGEVTPKCFLGRSLEVRFDVSPPRYVKVERGVLGSRRACFGLRTNVVE